MICVSIARGRHKQVIAEHQHLAEQGAQLVELRLDYLRRHPDLSRLIQDRPTPVVVTCRRERDMGRWSGSEEARQTLLRAAIVAGVEYVDLEEDIAASIPRYGRTKRIISYHNFQDTPQNLSEIHARLAKLDPDVIKIATMARTVRDNLRMLQLVRDSEIPTVGLCMGEIGTPTRLLCGKFGAPFTYATFHHERTLAPGQLSFRQMKEIYDYDHIGPETVIFGVMGSSLKDSLFPRVMNAAFRELDLDMAYIPFETPEQDMDAVLDDAPQLDVRGLTVERPFKSEARLSMDRFDDPSEAARALNVVVYEGEDKAAYNTEGLGAVDSLAASYGEEAGPEPLRGKTVVILGAGAVARAIAFELGRRGAHVVMAARDMRRAEDLAERLHCRLIEWEARHTIKANIVINATPVGMHPNVDETPYERNYLFRNMVIFDTVYYPEQTLLIKEARTQGCVTVTGVDMFVRQAAHQFRLFTGREAPQAVMREELLRAIRPVRS